MSDWLSANLALRAARDAMDARKRREAEAVEAVARIEAAQRAPEGVEPMGFVIRRGPAARPVDEFLLEVAHMTFEWSGERAAARRFASRGEAERCGRNMLAAEFHVEPA